MRSDYLKILGASILAGMIVLASQWLSDNLMPALQTPVSPAAEGNVLLVMNEEQFEGKWKQFKGELKRQWGRVTDDDLLQIEGSHEKFVGKILEQYGNQKEDVKRWTEEWIEKAGSGKQPGKRSDPS